MSKVTDHGMRTTKRGTALGAALLSKVLLTAVLLTALLLASCGVEDLQRPNNTLTLGTSGASDTPLVLALGANPVTVVPFGMVYMQLTATTATHTITTVGALSDVSWELFADATTWGTAIFYCDVIFSAAEETCQVGVPTPLTVGQPYGLTLTEWDTVSPATVMSITVATP